MNKVELSNIINTLPISSLLLIGLLSLIPIISISMTSYIKVSVVLSILRSALGGAQIPSQAVSGILAVLISFITVEPMLEVSYDRISKSSKQEIVERITYVSDPLIQFVKENVQIRERVELNKIYYDRLKNTNGQVLCDQKSNEYKQCLDKNERVSTLLLAFILGEIRLACNIGLYILAPFLIIDLVVSTLLTGFGMMMVSPVTITFPVKILVFLLSDGWRLLIENLVLTYKIPEL